MLWLRRGLHSVVIHATSCRGAHRLPLSIAHGRSWNTIGGAGERGPMAELYGFRWQRRGRVAFATYFADLVKGQARIFECQGAERFV